MFLLNLFLAFNLIVLFAGLFFKEENSLPNKILALILLDAAVSFLGNASVTGGYFAYFPYFFFLSWCTSSFFGPLFFTYTCLFTGGRLNLKHPVWIAAFLLAAFGLSFPVTYLMLPESARPEFTDSLLSEPLPWQMTVINLFGMLTIWASLAAAAFKVVHYRKRLIATMSNLEKTKLNYITRFVQLGFILTLATTVFYLALPQYQVEYLYLPLLITAIYLFILYYSFRHHAIFTATSYSQFLSDTLPAGEENIIPSERVEIIGGELQELAKRIQDYLSQSEAYTNPDFTIRKLADALSTTVEKVSSAINKEMNKNFYDLINEKRVSRVKEVLKGKMDQLTIEGIALEAGFNSRASFYRAFKKYTSLTPSQFASRSDGGSGH